MCCGLAACGRIGYDPLSAESSDDDSDASSADISNVESTAPESGPESAAFDRTIGDGLPTADMSAVSIADVGSHDVRPAVCTEPNGTIDPTSGHCYFLTTSADVWATLRDRCTSQGTHLVTIGSASEQAFVVNWLTSLGNPQKDRWLGLFQAEAAPFEWVTGEPVVFTNWGAGEPNDGPDACGRIQPGGAWADWALCDGKFTAICEREP